MQQRAKNILNSIFQKIKSHPKISIAIAVPLLLGFIIRKQQYRMIYMPKIPGMARSPSYNPYPYRNPGQHGFHNYKNVQIKTSDGKILRGWYVSPNEKKSERLILYYQQNAGNIGARLPFIKQLVQNTNSDVMLVAYRGYSDSQGTPSQKGLKIDGQQIMRYAINQAKEKKIPLVVFGRSLGGAVAINSCSMLQNQERDLKGLVLQNTFTSIQDVALHLFAKENTKNIVKFFLFFLLSNHWQSYKLIGKINVPKLFIKSAMDQLIPIQQMNKLQQLSSPRKQQYVIQRGTHNQSYTLEYQVYFRKLNRFLSSL